MNPIPHEFAIGGVFMPPLLVAGILGTLEASEVIKTALGLPNLENKLLMVNLLDLSFNKIDVVKDGNCTCSK